MSPRTETNNRDSAEKRVSFWDKVYACEHKNLSPNYSEYIYCGTPYCSGSEEHCLDCGAYIQECGCGYNNGMSGWSHKQYKTRSTTNATRFTTEEGKQQLVIGEPTK